MCLRRRKGLIPDKEKSLKGAKFNQKWVEVGGIGLNMQDRKTILSEKGWLDDRMVNAAQTLLKLHFSTPGLQHTTLGSNLSFDVVQRDFVQILHNGTNHWVTISNLNAQPSHCNIYDSSMFHSIFDHATVADQICAIMHSSQPMITVHHANVDKQMNGHDCGVYAIAFATSLCYGQDVMSIHYDNHKMRQHLVKCLEGAKMLPFPSTYEEKSIRFVKSETIDLFCHCRGPESELMIQCDGCSEWYHVECERSIPQKAVKVKKHAWFCRICKERKRSS